MGAKAEYLPRHARCVHMTTHSWRWKAEVEAVFSCFGCYVHLARAVLKVYRTNAIKREF